MRLSWQLGHRALVAVVALMAACAREQWVVSISTDARVPQFGDRLLVDVIDVRGARACQGCRRQFGVGDPLRLPVSFGVLPDLEQTTSALYIRARLYRADHENDVGLPTQTYIDAMGRLPITDGKISEVQLPLRMACFGVESVIQPGVVRTCNPDTGLLDIVPELHAGEAVQPGSWPPGLTSPCPPNAEPAGMRCVPGGAFVLGGLRALNSVLDGIASTPERLVSLRPYYMDVDEITVKDWYALQQTPPSRSCPQVPTPSLGKGCHATGGPDDKNNALPLNCVQQNSAQQICQCLGKRLPTESEWEYAAGSRDMETIYPWGDDENYCVRGIIERNPFGFANCLIGDRGQMLPPGPQPGGHPADVGSLGIRNLGGNLSEWVADRFAAYNSPCWTPQTYGRNWLDNPRCDGMSGDNSPQFSYRGGNWFAYSLFALTATRSRGQTALPVLGFRCVRDVEVAH